MRDFTVLCDVEFEEVVADLLAAELGRPVERFAAGGDGGIDLRWDDPSGDGKGVGQCKHYQRSTFSQLLAAAKAELPHLQTIMPRHYRFITSFDLTVGQKKKLCKVFAGWVADPSDVLGARDVDGLLTLHSSVERRHPKLWLATGSQLFWSTHAGLANRASAFRQRIESSLPLYVMNRGYRDALAVLDAHHVCVIAGVPGIGKTMLAQVLVADAIASGFEPLEVSGDIDEAWSAVDTDQPQVFLYDDFLGQLSFSERLGKNEDARLADFITKVSSSKSKRLIMTTREYILRDAQRTYERLRGLDGRMHFVLALSDYTTGDRARILYNHLWRAEASAEALSEIAAGGYQPIVDHAHYNPRLIEYRTGAAFDTRSSGYVDRVVNALNHPERLWRVAFDSHLTKEQQLLAVTLAAMPPRAEITDLEEAYRSLCRAQAVPVTAALFRTALEVMDGTFIAIGRLEGESTVTFHNPSIREFTLDWLADDRQLVATVLTSVTYFEQLRQLYVETTGSSLSGGHSALLETLEARAQDFREAMQRTIYSPSLTRRTEWDREEGQVYRRTSAWLEDRLEFILSLRARFAPDNAWIEELLVALEHRWKTKIGRKSDAVKVMRMLTKASHGACAVSISPPAAQKLGSALDKWLEQDLEDTEEDWLPYLERLKKDHRVVLRYRSDLAVAFEDHVIDELSRWSPSPPSMDELLEYAAEFGLEELTEVLATKNAEGRQRDHTASLKLQELPSRMSSPNETDDESDGALEQLFGRLASRHTISNP